MASTVEIPKQHKACVYDKPGTASTKVEMIDTPEPGPGEVLINLYASIPPAMEPMLTYCARQYPLRGLPLRLWYYDELGTILPSSASQAGLNHSQWKSLPYPTSPGQIGGHEGVGTIAKLGPGAELAGVKVGDRVVACLEGYDGVCFNQAVSGYYTPGTFQQYVLGPANYVTPIPESLSSAEAAPMLCAGLTTYAALKRSNAKAGQWVIVSGAGGGLGHIACQLGARGMGLRVIGIDAASKQELVLSSGAEHFIDLFAHADGAALTAEVLRLTDGLGAAAVIVCTANNKAYAQAMGFLRFGGTLVCVGMPEGELTPIATAYPNTMCAKMLSITSVAVGNQREAREVLDFAARGVVKTHLRVEKMERLTSVFEEMAEGKLMGRVVLDLS
ncbi:hypothetical protein MMC11_000284 [Xylographa trunciseda]|nr:hypothetical protein [Xylographa trunciseda]